MDFTKIIMSVLCAFSLFESIEGFSGEEQYPHTAPKALQDIQGSNRETIVEYSSEIRGQEESSGNSSFTKERTVAPSSYSLSDHPTLKYDQVSSDEAIYGITTSEGEGSIDSKVRGVNPDTGEILNTDIGSFTNSDTGTNLNWTTTATPPENSDNSQALDRDTELTIENSQGTTNTYERNADASGTGTDTITIDGSNENSKYESATGSTLDGSYNRTVTKGGSGTVDVESSLEVNGATVISGDKEIESGNVSKGEAPTVTSSTVDMDFKGSDIEIERQGDEETATFAPNPYLPPPPQPK